MLDKMRNGIAQLPFRIIFHRLNAESRRQNFVEVHKEILETILLTVAKYIHSVDPRRDTLGTDPRPCLFFTPNQMTLSRLVGSCSFARRLLSGFRG